MATRAEPVPWGAAVKAGAVRGGAMLGGVALLGAGVLMALALATYHPGDPSLDTAAGGGAENWLGLPGAWFADLAIALLGPVAAGLFLVTVPIIGLRMVRAAPTGNWKRMVLLALAGATLMAATLSLLIEGAVLAFPAGWGGILGMIVAAAARGLIGLTGDATAELWLSRGLGVSLGLGGLSLWAWSFVLDGGASPRRLLAGSAAPKLLPQPRAAAAAVIKEPRITVPRAVQVAEERPAPVIAERTAAASAKPPRPKQNQLDLRDSFVLPTADLLTPAPARPAGQIDRTSLERNARLLETVLDDFNVKGQVVEVKPGPVVTLYELEPASGIKASRVIALADDIARNMSAVSARVATVPGRTVIGIELPNPVREAVSLHEMVASDEFEDQNATLPLILGKDISGHPVIADLAPMPHLLVAGTTGSGKSVGLNCMILSLLYKMTPDQCRLIMIDPKMLELSMYDDIPHLLSPVVTDPAKAVRALKWAVEQMEDRYRQMSSVGVRSLASFNEKVRSAAAKGQPLGRKVQVGWDENGRPLHEEEQLDFKPLPLIVVVVDELADLMMTAGKEVEFLIQRLAQKARAAGIHLIMATQRPSVDVITGVIKANLPTRISFHVTSKIDSRTILGEQGAEQLLGKGDMLFMNQGKGLFRVHGPFVSDDEVRAVADHWRAQGAPDYVQSVTEEPEDGSFALEGAPPGDDSPEEQTYRNAIQLVCGSQKASTSWLQRQLRVGYNSAARLIERMENDGIVSAPDHVGRRDVLRDRDGNPV